VSFKELDDIGKGLLDEHKVDERTMEKWMTAPRCGCGRLLETELKEGELLYVCFFCPTPQPDL
jgi:hypothetical protein